MGESNTGSWRTQTPFSTTASTAQPTEQCVQTVRRTTTPVEPAAGGSAARAFLTSVSCDVARPTPTPRPERRGMARPTPRARLETSDEDAAAPGSKDLRVSSIGFLPASGLGRFVVAQDVR